MGIGFKHGSSGGGALGITVVPGTTRPSAPGENTIWVNSDSALVSWVISPVQPNGTPGQFWIETDPESEMDIIVSSGKNIIVVRLRSVYEYTANDGWVERDAEVYHDGAWSELKPYFYLYNKGNSTGYSFACDTTMKQTSSGWNGIADRVTVGSSSISVATSASRAYDFTNIFATNTSGSFVTVDLSKYTKVRIKGTVSGVSGNNDCVFRVLTAMGDLCTENNAVSQSFTSGTIDATVDISAIDSSCYLGFTFYNPANPKGITFELTELWLE